jgi:hypothetical protein
MGISQAVPRERCDSHWNFLMRTSASLPSARADGLRDQRPDRPRPSVGCIADTAARLLPRLRRRKRFRNIPASETAGAIPRGIPQGLERVRMRVIFTPERLFNPPIVPLNTRMGPLKRGAPSGSNPVCAGGLQSRKNFSNKLLNEARFERLTQKSLGFSHDCLLDNTFPAAC